MRYVRQSSLVEALMFWGRYEAAGRLRGRVKLQARDALAAIELALRYRAPLVSRLLGHVPVDVQYVELEPGDASALVLADGRRPTDWIAQAAGESAAHFRWLVDTGAPWGDPLIVMGRMSEPGPIVVYDGWHRCGAWVECCRTGRSSAMPAYLVVPSMC